MYATLNEQDDLEVMTSEGVHFSLEIAGIGSRMLAVLVDSIIKLILWAPFVMAFYSISEDGYWEDTWFANEWSIAGILIVMFIILFAYEPAFEWLWSGQTPGKRLMRLRVVKDDGNFIGFVAAALRRIMSILDYFGPVGLLVAMFNNRTKRLGDVVAGTVVIKDRDVKLSMVDAPVALKIPQKQVDAILRRLDVITADERRLLRKLPTRLNKMERRSRRSLIDRLARHFSVKLKVTPAVDNKTFLYEIARICDAPERGRKTEE